jgi:hypothetical protein
VKKNVTEFPTIDDLMLGKDQATPENLVLTHQMDLSYRLIGRPKPLDWPINAQIANLVAASAGLTKGIT